jgi:clan AA aspartic protease
MGIVHTKITLENPVDVTNASNGLIKAKDVRRMRVNAMVDTGAWDLIINEATRAQLGLRITKTSAVETAGGVTEKCSITEPVNVRWRDREFGCTSVVLPNEPEVLLGAIPLEGMDLMVHPRLKKVIGAHGDEPLYVVK